jgi:hypothetical protein
MAGEKYWETPLLLQIHRNLKLTPEILKATTIYAISFRPKKKKYRLSAIISDPDWSWETNACILPITVILIIFLKDWVSQMFESIQSGPAETWLY